MLYQLSYAHHITTCGKTSPASCRFAEWRHPAGLEPATIRLEGGCSIQLSYGRFIHLHSMLSANFKLWQSQSQQPTCITSYPASGCARQAGRMLYRGRKAVNGFLKIQLYKGVTANPRVASFAPGGVHAKMRVLFPPDSMVTLPT